MTHGTTTSYAHGCRCETCMAAKRAYDRQYWRNRGRPAAGNRCTNGKHQFKTQRAAAKALGVTPATISYHLNRHGNLDRIGERVKHRSGGNKKPIRVGSREWPSRAEFIRYLGVHDSVGRKWLALGMMERIVVALMAADARRAA